MPFLFQLISSRVPPRLPPPDDKSTLDQFPPPLYQVPQTYRDLLTYLLEKRTLEEVRLGDEVRVCGMYV